MTPAALSLLVLGCAPPAPDDTAATGGEDSYTPAPYVVEEQDPPQPTFSAEEVAVAIGEAIVAAPGINGAPVFPAYHAAMEGQSAGCPDFYEADGNVYWYDYCTSESGSSYEGYSFYYEYVDYDAGDGMIYNGEVLAGVSVVRDDAGHTLQVGGTAGVLKADAQDGSYTLFQSVVQGSFAWDGPEADGTWMADAIAPDLVMYAYYLPDYDGRAMVLDGGLSDLGGAFSVVVFDNVILFDQNLGGACPEEPAGLISVRDQEGNWYDITLDGETEWGGGLEDPSKCDGCGTAWFHGEQVGEVCADFTLLTAWGDSPW